MPKRNRPPDPLVLTLPPQPLSQDEIDTVLMAADGIIASAGRSGLALILAGSRSQKVLKNEWDQVEYYGAFSDMTAKVVTTLIDWCIHNDWLKIEHTRDGIPLIVHSHKGWERTKEVWVALLLKEFTTWVADGQPANVHARMEHINRQIKLMVLAAIEEDGRKDLVPVLRAWFEPEVRKMREAINETLEVLGQKPRKESDRKKAITYNT